jgi:hypothetical protein
MSSSAHCAAVCSDSVELAHGRFLFVRGRSSPATTNCKDSPHCATASSGGWRLCTGNRQSGGVRAQGGPSLVNNTGRQSEDAAALRHRLTAVVNRARAWVARDGGLLETRHPRELLPPRDCVNRGDDFRDTTGSKRAQVVNVVSDAETSSPGGDADGLRLRSGSAHPPRDTRLRMESGANSTAAIFP